MFSAWIGQLVFALTWFAFPAQQAPAAQAANPSAQVVASVRADLEQVAKAKQAAERAWPALEAGSGGQNAAKGDFVAEWMRTVAPNGPAATPFYAGTEKLLVTWISAI